MLHLYICTLAISYLWRFEHLNIMHLYIIQLSFIHLYIMNLYIFLICPFGSISVLDRWKSNGFNKKIGIGEMCSGTCTAICTKTMLQSSHIQENTLNPNIKSNNLSLKISSFLEQPSPSIICFNISCVDIEISVWLDIKRIPIIGLNQFLPLFTDIILNIG